MIEIFRDVPLAPFTTFRIGGPAGFFASIRGEEELVEALAFAASEKLPLFALGGGSNLFVPDAGFPGLVLHMAIGGPIERQDNRFDVPAGFDWDTLVREVCGLGLSGMECLAGIPGLVGASPIQNIGAYGQEVAQTIESVRAYDRDMRRFTTLTKQECGFAYRQSIFNTTHRDRYLITRVMFMLDPGAGPNLSYPDLQRHFAGKPQPAPLEVYKAVRAIRWDKGMILLPDGADGVEDTRSAGSFFKNPVVPVSALAPIAEALQIPEEKIPRYPADAGCVKLPAAWLLEQAGFYRGYTAGAAGISSRHTLALINRGGASYANVSRLRDLIVQAIKERFHLMLEQEPVEPTARISSEDV